MDIDRARAFYESMLLIDADDTVPTRLYFHCEDVIVALIDWSVEGRGTFAPTPEDLYFAVEDLDGVYTRALAADARITSPMEKRPLGERSFYCMDLSVRQGWATPSRARPVHL
jgi:hypothetical protein